MLLCGGFTNCAADSPTEIGFDAFRCDTRVSVHNFYPVQTTAFSSCPTIAACTNVIHSIISVTTCPRISWIQGSSQRTALSKISLNSHAEAYMNDIQVEWHSSEAAGRLDGNTNLHATRGSQQKFRFL
jgi:hypothetical protein